MKFPSRALRLKIIDGIGTRNTRFPQLRGLSGPHSESQYAPGRVPVPHEKLLGDLKFGLPVADLR
jgi:hypothetical protein